MIATTTLAKVDTDRLQRGVEGLTAGAYAITLTRQTEQEISAYVTNGDGKTYSVTLTEGRSFCGCGDSMFRGKTCKHSVALALHVIRTPHATVKPEPERKEGPAAPNLTLANVRRGCYARSAPF
jgi:uncharacterized Zn finger protein